MPDKCAKEKSDYDKACRDEHAAEAARKKALHAMLDATTTYVMGSSVSGANVAMSAWESNRWKGAIKIALATVGALLSMDQNGKKLDAAREAYDQSVKNCEEAWNEVGRALVALVNCQNDQKKTGCGSRGGLGWRREDGKCASSQDWPSGSHRTA